MIKRTIKSAAGPSRITPETARAAARHVREMRLERERRKRYREAVSGKIKKQ